MQFDTVAMLDAQSGRWYGVLIGQVANHPAKILDQTDPVYRTKEDCLADMKRMLAEALRGVVG